MTPRNLQPSVGSLVNRLIVRTNPTQQHRLQPLQKRQKSLNLLD